MSIQEIEKMPHSADTEKGGVIKEQQTVRWIVPFALLACVLLAFFDKISIAALFTDPEFQQTMGADPKALGLLMTSFLLSYGVSSMILGGIGDRFNPCNLLVWMMISWSALMGLMGLTTSYQGMIALRVLLGIAEGPLIPVAFMVIRHVFPPHFQARATMLWLLGTPIGAAIGFPITMFVLHHFGWQATFFAMSAITVPVIFLVFYSLRGINPHKAKTETVDKAVAERPTFVRKEDYLALLKHWPFWCTCIFNMSFLTYLWGMNSWLPSYLINGRGIHLDSVGYLTSLPFVGMLCGEVLGAWLSDRHDRRALACFVSLLGASAGLLLVLYLNTPYAIVGAMSFSMFMWGFGAPNIFALLGKVTEKRISAAAGGIFNGLGNFMGALAPTIMGALIAVTHKMDSSLIFLVLVAFCGSALLLPLIKRY